jgi:hypothetical protein
MTSTLMDELSAYITQELMKLISSKVAARTGPKISLKKCLCSQFVGIIQNLVFIPKVG